MTTIIKTDRAYIGAALVPEAEVYAARVSADGGSIDNMDAVEAIFLASRSMTLPPFVAVHSPEIGVKYDGSGNVTKAYNPFGAAGDALPHDGSIQVVDHASGPIFHNNGSSLKLTATFDSILGIAIAGQFDVDSTASGFVFWVAEPEPNELNRVYRAALTTDNRLVTFAQGASQAQVETPFPPYSTFAGVVDESDTSIYRDGELKATADMQSRGGLVQHPVEVYIANSPSSYTTTAPANNHFRMAWTLIGSRIDREAVRKLSMIV